MQKNILFALFLCVHLMAWGQNDLTYRYWFDDNDAECHTGSLEVGLQQLVIDVTGLDDKLHIIRFQVEDATGTCTPPVARHFIKMPTRGSMKTKYWFDEGSVVHDFIYSADSHQIVDVSNLGDGMHVMYILAEDASAQAAPLAKMFVKIPQTEGTDNLTCVCYVDGNIYKQEQVPSSNGAVLWDFNVSDLEQGIHRIHLQVITSCGVATSLADHLFLRTATTQELESMQLVYYIDGGVNGMQKGQAANGGYHFDVDVASLPDGLHTISYLLSNDAGTKTDIRNAFFWKTPLGNPGIKSYSYWLNDKQSDMKTVTLEEAANPLQLVTMLPVEQQSIRSSQFHFAVEEGKPLIYAKNDIHFRFRDRTDQTVDTAATFVDIAVREPVEKIIPLASGVPHTTSKPVDNKIVWYQIQAGIGDSLIVKADKTCTIQIFSPSGNEIYSASGSLAATEGVAKAKEDGTHYIAVHDVTDSHGDKITVDYMRIAGDGDITDIDSVKTTTAPASVYTTDGKYAGEQPNGIQHGIYITKKKKILKH